MSEASLAQDWKVLDHAISHDLEGSLRGIKNLGTILQQKYASELSKDAQEMVGMLSTEAGRASQLLIGLLEWTRIGRQTCGQDWHDATHLAQEAISLVKARFPLQKTEFHLAPLPLIWGARASLVRVFLELISNAAKFSRTRSPSSVWITAEDGAGETLIQIKDNGVGFEPAHSTRMFCLFQRLHRQQDFEGVGVGLAIVERIMQQHGGRIRGDGRIDEGAIFHLALPKPKDATGSPVPDLSRP